MADHSLDAMVYATSILKDLHMGSDIHWYSETKKEGKWVCDQAPSFVREVDSDYPDMDSFPNDHRDYWFFGFLQPGVRTDWPWSFPERLSIPEDASREVKEVYRTWSGDAHNAGYRTLSELITKREELKTLQVKYLISPADLDGEQGAFNHCLTRLDEIISNLTSEVPDTDQRIVFWFDN